VVVGAVVVELVVDGSGNVVVVTVAVVVAIEDGTVAGVLDVLHPTTISASTTPRVGIPLMSPP
jgi:hypothetical protein